MAIILDTGVSPGVVVSLDCPDDEVDALVVRYCLQNNRDPKLIIVCSPRLANRDRQRREA